MEAALLASINGKRRYMYRERKSCAASSLSNLILKSDGGKCAAFIETSFFA